MVASGFLARRSMSLESWAKTSSADDSAPRATPHNVDWFPGMSASLVNVSLFNKDIDHLFGSFVQHSNNVRDRKFMIGEEITDRDLSLRDLVNSI